MQLLLSFAQKPATPAEPDLWTTLPSEQRNKAMAVLARLLAKAATIDAAANPIQEEQNND